MTRTIRLKYPDGDYHTALVSRFVSSTNGKMPVLSLWYKDETEIERTGNDISTFTLLKKNEDNTYTHLYCGDDYDAIYEELSHYIQDGDFKDLDLETLPNAIDLVEEYDYFGKREEKELPPEKDIENIIKINKLDSYLLYRYKSSMDLGDFLSLSFVNITDSFINDVDEYEIKETECIGEYMFFELFCSDTIFVKKEKDLSPIDCLENAINKKMTLITRHNIFSPEQVS